MYILAIIIIFTGLIFVFNLKPEDIMKRKNITTVIITCFAICFILILIAVIYLVKFVMVRCDVDITLCDHFVE